MSDYLLFAVAPYIAAVALLVVPGLRSAPGVSHPVNGGRTARRRFLARLVIGGCIVAVTIGHIVLLAAPAAVLRWNRSTPRLLLLEGAGFCLGLGCLVAVARAIARHVREAAQHPARPLVDLIALTLIAVAVVSGVGLAVVYRWASAWSVVTLTPYAVSLVHLRPRIELVAATPFLVRLHVFCTFAIAPLLPFTAMGSLALVATRRLAGTVTRPVSIAFRRARAAVEDWIRRHARLEAIWGEKEN